MRRCGCWSRRARSSYRPRRGYFVTELRVEDLEEIYELRQVLEERAARKALPTLDEDAFARIALPRAGLRDRRGAR